MALEIAHFAIGAIGALSILIWYPQILPQYIRYDTFFILASGLWSMLPDIKMIISKTNSTFLHQPWANIFWGHPWIDSLTADDPKTAAIFIAIAIIFAYIYFKKINGG
jgi:hypothetical protein